MHQKYPLVETSNKIHVTFQFTQKMTLKRKTWIQNPQHINIFKTFKYDGFVYFIYPQKSQKINSRQYLALKEKKKPRTFETTNEQSKDYTNTKKIHILKKQQISKW